MCTYSPSTSIQLAETIHIVYLPLLNFVLTQLAMNFLAAFVASFKAPGDQLNGKGKFVRCAPTSISQVMSLSSDIDGSRMSAAINGDRCGTSYRVPAREAIRRAKYSSPEWS